MNEEFKPRSPDYKGEGYSVWIEGNEIKLKYFGWARAVTLIKANERQ